ncbi:biotin--[acetyl-CoA-carboxylase] ligase [Flavobacterium dankookense]|uniref:BirA family biotin operon repressor/biotin-[acetyl-CoA-carboxylase] ligase n=1 Tax=Flavobacterium dankookense TaxID=706186 RepID=A0A4V3CS70_9FLAO|nr:biotin--[acetyl-CoA-carboxylase] ligase [Flavobacterium dankookense]TDP59492.1 BirA family biotin operon repressor/biotin-[acetyl-CoA-carboxylase] ligase [Flavobacterium dankookense]
MQIIKLSAIDSTNDYLKQLSREKKLDNFTIVVANEQTKGRGQMGSKWMSEAGKNLTFSALVKNVMISNERLFDWNIVVALAVLEVLEMHEIQKVSIKWPNDIMADSKKVGGILIENVLKNGESFDSVVGIGLNLNQTNFEHLPKATSLKSLTGKEYDIFETAEEIAKKIQEKFQQLDELMPVFRNKYHEKLFKKDKPLAFEDSKNNRFMGIIQGVTHDGKLQVMLEDDSISFFNIKEIQMLF